MKKVSQEEMEQGSESTAMKEEQNKTTESMKVHTTREGSDTVTDESQSEDDDATQLDNTKMSQDEGGSTQDTYCSEPSQTTLNRRFCLQPERESSNETLEGTTSFGTHTEADMFATQASDYDDFKESKLMQSSSTLSESSSARKRKFSESEAVCSSAKLQCIEEEPKQMSPSKVVREDIKDDELTITSVTSRKLAFDSRKEPEESPEVQQVLVRRPRESIQVLYVSSDKPVDLVDLEEDSQLNNSEDLCLHLSPSPTPRSQELNNSEVIEQSGKRKRDETTVSVSPGPLEAKKLKTKDELQLSESREDVVTPISEDTSLKFEECVRQYVMEVSVHLKYTLHDNKVVQQRVVQCDNVTDVVLKKLHDYSSSGGMGDISSKNTSPSSCSSGPGPFTLQPARLSLMSLLSGSSSSSGGSGVPQQRGLTAKQTSDGQFAVPILPKKPTPEHSLDGLEHVAQALLNAIKSPETNEIIPETPKSRIRPLTTSTAKKTSRMTKNIKKTDDTTKSKPKETEAGEALKPGELVFARWTDRKYYSGKVKEMNKDGRWVVDFDDGNSKALVPDFVIPVKDLDKGQSVYALAEDEEYLSGVIVKVEKKRGDTVYSVELDEGQTVSVSRSSLFMTEDQAKTLKECMVTASPLKTTPQRITDVSLDNVLEGKRSRTRSKEVKKVLECPAGVSGTGKSTPKRKISSPVSSESDLETAVDYVDGVDPEIAERAIKSDRVKGLGRLTGKRNKLSEDIGPIPEDGSKIFAGKCFLLTHSDVKLEHFVSEVSDPASNDDMTDYDEPKLQFSKSYLTKQIEAGGGDVYLRFEDVPSSKYKSCYLVANKPSQTALYILCLAHGIPIIANTWIIESCKKNVSLPISSYVLPAGYSLEKKEFVCCSKTQPLHKMKIGLVSQVKYFVKFWRKVLEAAGANVCVIPPQRDTKEMKDMHVYVSNHCPLEISKEIEDLGKTLVTTKWVVQCLVNGKKLPYTGQYDFSHTQSDE